MLRVLEGWLEILIFYDAGFLENLSTFVRELKLKKKNIREFKV